MFFSLFLYLCTWQSNSTSRHLNPSSNLRRNYGAICVCVRKLSLCNHEQNRLHHSPNQFEMHTIMHGTRAQQLIMPFQILLRPGHQIRRQTAFTLNNWDYPAGPSDVTARRNTLKTSENAHRLTSRQRNSLLKHSVCVCLNQCLKGQFNILANSVLPPSKLMENAIQQPRNALVGKLWRAHLPCYEIMMHYYESEQHFRHTWWAEGFQKRIFSAARLVMTVMHLSWFVKIKKRVIFVDQTSESNKHYFYYFFNLYTVRYITSTDASYSVFYFITSSGGHHSRPTPTAILHLLHLCCSYVFVMLCWSASKTQITASPVEIKMFIFILCCNYHRFTYELFIGLELIVGAAFNE